MDSSELDRKNKEAVQQAWSELNPLNHLKPSHPKTLIDLLDDFFSICVDRYPDPFLLKCKDLGIITRCRKGEFNTEKDILPPSIDIAEANNIVNRWNPPGKRYLYAAHSRDNPQYSGLTQNEYTCFKEMRAKKGIKYTFADFRARSGSEDKSILNMDYTGILQSDINAYCEKEIQNHAYTIASGLLKARVNPSRKQLQPMIQRDAEKLATFYIGSSFFLPICQTIFTAIDDDKCADGKAREKAYKSFHVLAEYLEAKNIAGVIYPSTRTALHSIHTQNIVIFNVEDFSAIPGSLRKLVY